MTMADRIVVMRDGRVEQIGAPLELYDSPCNLFVAQFIGSPAMNVFEGELHRADHTGRTGGAAWCLQDADGTLWPIEVPAGASPDLMAQQAGLVQGQRLHYGVRPEDLVLAAGPVPGKTIKAEVLLVEPIGPQTEVVMKAGTQDLTIVMPGRPVVEIGQCVYLQVTPGRVHLFDGASGERIGNKACKGSPA